MTTLPTSSFFSSADSVAMIRGGPIDLALPGVIQVAENGDFANWTIPGKMIKGMGGAMDLVAGEKRVLAVMEHTHKSGSAKVLESCTLPRTGTGVVDVLVTDLAVFTIDKTGNGGTRLTELAPCATAAEVRARTDSGYAETARSGP